MSSGIETQQTLFDHLVGKGKQRGRSLRAPLGETVLILTAGATLIRPTRVEL
jgi:hypothetical protein